MQIYYGKWSRRRLDSVVTLICPRPQVKLESSQYFAVLFVRASEGTTKSPLLPESAGAPRAKYSKIGCRRTPVSRARLDVLVFRLRSYHVLSHPHCRKQSAKASQKHGVLSSGWHVLVFLGWTFFGHAFFGVRSYCRALTDINHACACVLLSVCLSVYNRN